jgi:hypothetical protein
MPPVFVCAPICGAPGYAYLNGQLVAEYKNSTTYFVHGDNLGSTRLVTDPSNPQSWNRYAYVLNNPMNFIDPSGLGPQDCNNGVPVSPDGLNSCDPCAGSTADSCVSVTEPPPAAIPTTEVPLPDQFPGGGSSPSPTWAAIKTFFTLPSTEPGSCIDVALSAMKRPITAVRSAAQNVTKYGAPIAPLLPGVAAQLGSMDPNSMYTFVLNPDGETVTAVLSANAVVATTVLPVVVQIAQAAIRATPYIAVVGAEIIAAVGVGKEAYAVATGKCHP